MAPDLDYVVDCLELGDRAALALVLKDRRFAARLFRQIALSGPYFRAAGRARKAARGG